MLLLQWCLSLHRADGGVNVSRWPQWGHESHYLYTITTRQAMETAVCFTLIKSTLTRGCACVRWRLCMRVSMCVCVHSLRILSISSPGGSCCVRVSEIPILMLFPSLINVAAFPLWALFINKTCSQSDCKHSINLLLGKQWVQQTAWLNVRESQARKERGVTLRWHNWKAATSRQFFYDCWKFVRPLIIFLHFFCTLVPLSILDRDSDRDES